MRQAARGVGATAAHGGTGGSLHELFEPWVSAGEAGRGRRSRIMFGTGRSVHASTRACSPASSSPLVLARSDPSRRAIAMRAATRCATPSRPSSSAWLRAYGDSGGISRQQAEQRSRMSSTAFARRGVEGRAPTEYRGVAFAGVAGLDRELRDVSYIRGGRGVRWCARGVRDLRWEWRSPTELPGGDAGRLAAP